MVGLSSVVGMSSPAASGEKAPTGGDAAPAAQPKAALPKANARDLDSFSTRILLPSLNSKSNDLWISLGGCDYYFKACGKGGRADFPVHLLSGLGLSQSDYDLLIRDLEAAGLPRKPENQQTQSRWVKMVLNPLLCCEAATSAGNAAGKTHKGLKILVSFLFVPVVILHIVFFWVGFLLMMIFAGPPYAIRNCLRRRKRLNAMHEVINRHNGYPPNGNKDRRTAPTGHYSGSENCPNWSGRLGLEFHEDWSGPPDSSDPDDWTMDERGVPLLYAIYDTDNENRAWYGTAWPPRGLWLVIKNAGETISRRSFWDKALQDGESPGVFEMNAAWRAQYMKWENAGRKGSVIKKLIEN